VRAVGERSTEAARRGGCPEFVATTPSQLAASFARLVKPGDDSGAIERGLSELGLAYSWDRFSYRYQAILRIGSSNFHAVVAWVYVDGERRFVAFQAQDSFTMP
jgi:hypothetical protein